MTVTETRQPIFVKNDSATKMSVRKDGGENFLYALPEAVCDLRNLTQSPEVHLDHLVVQFLKEESDQWTPTPQRRSTSHAQQKVTDVYHEKTPA